MAKPAIVTSKVTPEEAPVVTVVVEEPKPSVPSVTQKVSLKTQAEQQAGRERLAAHHTPG